MERPVFSLPSASALPRSSRPSSDPRHVHVLQEDARRRRADRHVVVVDVEGIQTVLAHLGLARRARVAGLALAAHGDLRVPEVVDVAVVRGGQVLRAHADAVARARRVAAGRLLAARARVAREAVALAGLAVADALVAALGVGVARVRERPTRRVDHERVLLGRAVGVDGRAGDDGRARAAQRVGGAVEVALGRVDVRRHEGAGPPGAVGLLPVRVADALVERAAGAVAGAGLCCLWVSFGSLAARGVSLVRFMGFVRPSPPGAARAVRAEARARFFVGARLGAGPWMAGAASGGAGAASRGPLPGGSLSLSGLCCNAAAHVRALGDGRAGG